MSDENGSASALSQPSLMKRWSLGLLLLIRRSHLYLGLLLSPWALLYGLTGYLFNHPTHFTDRGLREISRATLVESGFTGSLPDPVDAAQEVIVELNKRFPDAAMVLSTEPAAKYNGDFYFATANGTQRNYQLLIRRDGGGGTYLEAAPPNKSIPKMASFAINPRGGGSSAPAVTANADQAVVQNQPLKIGLGTAAVAESILPTLASKLDLPGLDKPFRLTSAPVLQFRAVSGDDEWLVKYDSFQGSLSAEIFDVSKPAEQPSWRTYLLRLHTAHGYPGVLEARWYWAVIVDVMSLVMIFWGISGLVMWWQIKRLRKLGAAVVAISLLAAITLFIAMAQ